MPKVALGLGSSIDPYTQISAGLDALLLEFGDLSLSSVFESKSVGFEGSNFLNMAVALETDLLLPDLSAWLKALEDKCGRDRSQPKFCDRKLDIDILFYGKLAGRHHGIELPRGEVTENAFVLWPLSQICPQDIHPLQNKSYIQLWQEYDKTQQQLWPVDFVWHKRKISSRD